MTHGAECTVQSTEYREEQSVECSINHDEGGKQQQIQIKLQRKKERSRNKRREEIEKLNNEAKKRQFVCQSQPVIGSVVQVITKTEQTIYEPPFNVIFWRPLCIEGWKSNSVV